MASRSNWETGEAYNWVASNPDGNVYFEARRQGSISQDRFREYVTTVLAGVETWDKADTEKIDWSELYSDVMD